DKLEIEPALLSLVCERLNEKRKGRGQRTIDAALLNAPGNTIIGDFYQHCVADVPDKTRRFIEDDLITEGGFRNSYPLLDALERARSPSPCCASWWIAAYCASTISSVSSVWNSSTAGSRTWCASTGTGSESACG